MELVCSHWCLLMINDLERMNDEKGDFKIASKAGDELKWENASLSCKKPLRIQLPEPQKPVS